MHAPGRHRRAPRALAAVAALLLAGTLVSLRSVAAEPASPSETRALWVLRTSLASPESIQALVRSARQNGFNTLLVQVRGRGDAYFAQGLEPRAAELQRQPDSFDPLATVLAAAHAAGLKVHAWVNVNTLWNQATPPGSADHVYHRHGPQAQGYDRWLNKRADGEERIGNNFFIDPGHPDAVEYIVAGVQSILQNYDVDGINLDYVRYPDHNSTTTHSDWSVPT